MGVRRTRTAPLSLPEMVRVRTGRGRVWGRRGGGMRMTANLHLDDRPERRGRRSDKEAVHRVVFMRHGECHWNRSNRFLGWADIELTEDGEKEARKAAHTLAHFDVHVDEVFCSYLKRSIKSAWLLADEMNQSWMPIESDWRLNEQMYGALQGLNKHATAERFGTELTQQWRRSCESSTPFGPSKRKKKKVSKHLPITWRHQPYNATRAAGLYPNTESLKDAQARSWAFWRERMVPRVKAGKTVLICGHGNIIRSMLKRLDGIPNDVLKQVSIPRAIPLVYELDEDLIPVDNPGSNAPLSGRFLGSALELAEAFDGESFINGGGGGGGNGGGGGGEAAP
eukprot:jgi/Undpi1/7517/HiC_scaffold_22.g09990.m1